MSAGWRTGTKITLNVYDEYGRPVCQCHTVEDAQRIVEAVNDKHFVDWVEHVAPETLGTWRTNYQAYLRRARDEARRSEIERTL